MSAGLSTQGEAVAGTNKVLAEKSKPQTVKERMQENVETARKNLEKALTVQAKAEILGINDWPVEQLYMFTQCQFEF